MLGLLESGQEQTLTELRGALAGQFELTQDEIDELLPSGKQTRLANRVTWAANYLYRCGLLTRPRRSVYQITDRGRTVIAENPDRVDLAVLSQFPELAEFRRARGTRQTDGRPAAPAAQPSATPEERIAEAYSELRSALAAELLDRIHDQTPDFFEQLVLDVLHAMGYGGRREDVQRLGRSGDEGVDGVIKDDALGLDLIYVQAKRWQNPVSRPDIQRFVGALHGQRASKGVFITTSRFSSEAVTYAGGITPRVILIDGHELADLMVNYGVGVASTQIYDVRKTDLDYFVTDDRSPMCAVPAMVQPTEMPLAA